MICKDCNVPMNLWYDDFYHCPECNKKMEQIVPIKKEVDNGQAFNNRMVKWHSQTPCPPWLKI